MINRTDRFTSAMMSDAADRPAPREAPRPGSRESADRAEVEACCREAGAKCFDGCAGGEGPRLPARNTATTATEAPHSAHAAGAHRERSRFLPAGLAPSALSPSGCPQPGQLTA